MKAIKNGRIILKDRIVDDAVLLYSDVIEGIVSENMIPEGAEVIDAMINANISLLFCLSVLNR